MDESLVEDISFGTGLPVEAIKKSLLKGTPDSLAALGADYYAEDGVTVLTRDAQMAQLEERFRGLRDNDPAVRVQRAKEALVAELRKPFERFGNWLIDRFPAA